MALIYKERRCYQKKKADTHRLNEGSMLARREERKRNPGSQALFHGPPTLKITNLPVPSTMTNN